MLKAVLFDLDGVLVDACVFHYDALNRALGFDISIEEHDTKYNGLSTKKKLQILAAEGRISTSDIDQIWVLKQKYTHEYINALEPDYEKLHMLQRLYENHMKSVCVTNAIHDTARMMLTKTGLIEYISFIVSNEDVKLNKPYPDPYLFAMDKLWMSPKDIMIVEDSDIGYKAAISVTKNVLRVNSPKDVNTQTIFEALNYYNSQKQ